MLRNHSKAGLAIETKNLTKRFGDFEAVKEVNLKIEKGGTYALIGPNGAGKTTLMKIIVGLLSPTSGTATIFGHDITKEPRIVKQFFGYIPDNPMAYDYLTGWEFLSLTGNLRGMEKVRLEKRIKELACLFPIEDILGQVMSSYSRGNRQKVAFLASFLEKPPLLFIDEPIAGLDPASIEIFGKTIRDHVKQGKTVFFISHSLSFAQKYADRVGLMQKGEIVKEEKVSKDFSIEAFLGV